VCATFEPFPAVSLSLAATAFRWGFAVGQKLLKNFVSHPSCIFMADSACNARPKSLMSARFNIGKRFFYD